MKLKDIKGVIGEKLPVKPAFMAQMGGRKAKVAGILGVIAAIAGALSQFLGG